MPKREQFVEQYYTAPAAAAFRFSPLPKSTAYQTLVAAQKAVVAAVIVVLAAVI